MKQTNKLGGEIVHIVSSSYLLLLCMGPKYGGVMMVHHSSSTERSLCSSERREEYNTAYEDLLCILYHHHNHKLTRGVLQMQKYVCDIFRFFVCYYLNRVPKSFLFSSEWIPKNKYIHWNLIQNFATYIFKVCSRKSKIFRSRYIRRKKDNVPEFLI